jgi:transposase-like protein
VNEVPLSNWVKAASPVTAGGTARAGQAGTVEDLCAQVSALRKENRELARANDVLKSASAFFGAELDRQSTRCPRSLLPIATRLVLSRSGGCDCLPVRPASPPSCRRCPGTPLCQGERGSQPSSPNPHTHGPTGQPQWVCKPAPLAVQRTESSHHPYSIQPRLGTIP